MSDILFVASEEGRTMLREVLTSCMKMRVTLKRLPDELAVREADPPVHVYRAIIIAHAHLPPCTPSTPVERLPNQKWHLQDPTTSGIRVLDWIVMECKKLRISTPPIFFGCHVCVENADIDHRENVRSRGGIPFYIDSTAAGNRTADGTLTVLGLINRLAEIA